MASTLLLHLSDIHFNGKLASPLFDLDAEIRSALERDLEGLHAQLGDFGGLIISGDVAFSGTDHQYEQAVKWVKTICAFVGCPDGNVWTVPGNHDVDRGLIRSSKSIRLLQDDLRGSGADLNRRIEESLIGDAAAGESLFRPIAAYNDFAGIFHCDVSREKPYWEHTLILNDRSRLKLRGITSTLVSDSTDNDRDRKLVVGAVQYRFLQEPGTEYMVICHHPPEWLLDRDAAEDAFRTHTRIQIFGHKHSPRAFRIANGVRLAAGATHPDRAELNWRPAYNVLGIGVEGSGNHREMVLDVYGRVWEDGSRSFQPIVVINGQGHEAFRIPLAPWENVVVGPAQVSSQEFDPDTSIFAEEDLGSEKLMNPARMLMYRFLTLPYVSKVEIATGLGLLSNDDAGIAEPELYLRYYSRAKDQGILAKFWDAVERAHGGQATRNPFS